MRWDRLQNLALPSLSVAFVFLLWHVLVTLLEIEPFVLPAPIDVIGALKLGFIDGRLYPHIWFTLRATLAF